METASETRRRHQKESQVLCQRGSGGGGEASTPTPVLPAPPVPVLLYGGRDDESDAHIGCNDFDSDPAGVTQVNVYRSTTSGGPYALVGTLVPGFNNEIFENDLLAANNYYYVMKSLGDGVIYQAVESDASGEVCALGTISDLAFFPGTTACDVTWSYLSPRPTLDWHMQLAQDNEFSTIIGEYFKTPTSGTLLQGLPFPLQANLDPEQPYFFRIRARNSTGCYSEWESGTFDTLA